MKRKKVVTVYVDFSKSFTDDNGSFTAHTTKDQKLMARAVSERSDLVIYAVDVHTKKSSEFIVNNGIYPTHNLIKKDQNNLELLGVSPEQTVSPQLTQILYDFVKDKKSGLIVPRHVFFQDFNGEKNPKPAFSFEDVEETFGVRKLDPVQFLDGDIEYVVNAKHMFNGASLQSTEWMGHVDGVPDMEMNVFTLLKQMYGQGEDLIFNFVGVVMGICIYQTSSNTRQIFPNSEINVIVDASTHLISKSLGFGDVESADKAIDSMCKQVGINYITAQEFIHKQ